MEYYNLGVLAQSFFPELRPANLFLDLIRIYRKTILVIHIRDYFRWFSFVINGDMFF